MSQIYDNGARVVLTSPDAPLKLQALRLVEGTLATQAHLTALLFQAYIQNGLPREMAETLTRDWVNSSTAHKLWLTKVLE